MQKTINRKDYYGGALMVLIGLGAIYGGSDYHIGTLSHMGRDFSRRVGWPARTDGRADRRIRAFWPGFEPAPGEAHSHSLPDLRGSVCILLGILAFLGLGHYGGLLPATFAIVFISALGDRNNTVKQALVLALGMSVVAVVVFWWALQLQLPLFRWG